jgi:hypothetical protein
MMRIFTRQTPTERPVATIAPNRRGGWALLFPDAGRAVGNYADPAAAAQVAILNGYTPEVQEAAR